MPCRVIDQIRRIMQEGQGITPRTATVLETWFASYTKAGGFKDDPIPKDLDLVESGEAFSAALPAMLGPLGARPHSSLHISCGHCLPALS